MKNSEFFWKPHQIFFPIEEKYFFYHTSSECMLKQWYVYLSETGPCTLLHSGEASPGTRQWGSPSVVVQTRLTTLLHDWVVCTAVRTPLYHELRHSTSVALPANANVTISCIVRPDCNPKHTAPTSTRTTITTLGSLSSSPSLARRTSTDGRRNTTDRHESVNPAILRHITGGMRS
jgi:hypothetical protein